MPRELSIVSRKPIGLDELIRLIDNAQRPLGVQGIDAGISAAVLTPEGGIVCTVSTPVRILAPAEFHRILPSEELDESRDFFFHSATTPVQSDGLGHELVERLADMVDGRVITTPRAQLDDGQ